MARYRYLSAEALKEPVRRRSSKRREAPERIAILAYEKIHATLVHSIIQISNYKTNYVVVFTNRFIFDEMKSYLGEDIKRVDWSLVPNRLSLKHPLYTQISEKISKTEGFDKIIIPSGEYYYKNYLPLLETPPERCEVIAMVHNLNHVLGRNLNENLYRAFSGAGAYAVPIRQMIDEIRRRGLTDKKVYEFPQIFRGGSVKERKNEAGERYVFVVTGIVDKGRKDYDLVTEVFEGLTDLYDRISLVLLGPAKFEYGAEIIARCESLKDKGLDVTYFDDYVQADLFAAFIRDCDYILGPVNTERPNEIYGVTKATGIVWDMIEYARPGIVPSSLKMPQTLQSSTVFYKSPEDLREQIIRLADPDVCKKLAGLALENSRKYSAENFYI